MGYIDSTPPQVVRLVGRWLLGVGAAAAFLGAGEWGSGRFPTLFAVGTAVAASGGVLLAVGTRRGRLATQANRSYFSAEAGTEVLATRRLLQAKGVRWRNALLFVTVGLGASWIVLAGTYSCVDGVCVGFFSDQGDWIARTRVVVIVAGIVTLALASFVLVHGQETDHWEEYASDALRRRDEGTVPGLKSSRWE